MTPPGPDAEAGAAAAGARPVPAVRAPDARPGYRPNVGMMLVDPRGRVFVGRRRDMTAAWQMPQGGIDPGETPAEAAMRELREEVGTDRASILAESAGWYHYDLPPTVARRLWAGRYRGQAQKWFLLRFLGDDGDVDIRTRHPEFDAWKWLAPGEVLAAVVPFKRAVYAAVLEEFSTTS